MRLNYIDREHEEFYQRKIREYENADCYHKALIYTLGICETTREHFNEIFGKNKELNFDSLQSPWQTSTSEKVVRMAFSLWNSSSMYESEKDATEGNISNEYNPSNIFCCSYAPYFYEAIKLRYPEYTKALNNESFKAYEILEEKEDNDKPFVCLYIRAQDKEMANIQKEQLLKYCDENLIENRTIYIDIGYSGHDINRPALNKMLEHIEKHKVYKVIFTNPEKIYRNLAYWLEFKEQCKKLGIDIYSLDNSLEEQEKTEKEIKQYIDNTYKEIESDEKFI